MKTKEELQAQARELFEYFDECDGGYHTRDTGHRMFEVNVKLHHMRTPDAVNLINGYPKRYRKALTDHFTEDFISGGSYGDLYGQWLEDQQQYLLDIVHSGGACVDDDPKSELRQAFGMIKCIKTTNSDGRTCYNTTAGFYGRSGGHFCFDIRYNPEPLQEVTAWEGQGDAIGYDEKPTIKDAEAIISEALKAQSAVEYIKDYVTKAKNALDFTDELKFRISEHIDELKAEEKRRRKEARDVAQKAKLVSVGSVTVAECLHHKKETIRRNAASIVKEL